MENKAERLKEPNAQMKKSARKDRRDYWQANIEDEEDELKKKWKKVRYMKKDYTPNYTKAEDMHGNRIPWGKKAHAIAEYLEKVQWKKEQHGEYPQREKIIEEDTNINTDEISLEELRGVIRQLKNNKAPGTNTITSEEVKMLHDEGLELVRTLLNIMWESEKISEDMTLASIVSLYKKRRHK